MQRFFGYPRKMSACDTDCKYEWRLVVRIRTDLLAQCLDILRSQRAPRHCRAVRRPRWSSGAFVCLQRTAPVDSLSCGSREAAPVTCVTEHKAMTNIMFTDLVFRCVLALARCLQLRPTPGNPATTAIMSSGHYAIREWTAHSLSASVSCSMRLLASSCVNKLRMKQDNSV